jgi:hypothetical protein
MSSNVTEIRSIPCRFYTLGMPYVATSNFGTWNENLRDVQLLTI